MIDNGKPLADIASIDPFEIEVSVSICSKLHAEIEVLADADLPPNPLLPLGRQRRQHAEKGWKFKPEDTSFGTTKPGMDLSAFWIGSIIQDYPHPHLAP